MIWHRYGIGTFQNAEANGSAQTEACCSKQHFSLISSWRCFHFYCLRVSEWGQPAEPQWQRPAEKEGDESNLNAVLRAACGSIILKKKPATNKQNHTKAAASSGKAEQRDGLSVVWMEKTAALRTANKLFCVLHLFSLSGALLVHLRWSQSKQIWRAACTDWPCSPESF